MAPQGNPELETVCPVCAGTRAVQVFTIGRLQSPRGTKRMTFGPMTTVLCVKCGLLFRYPVATEAELESYYQSEYYQNYQGGVEVSLDRLAHAKERNRRRLNYLQMRIDFTGKRVLDAGCGRAILLDQLASTGQPIHLLGLEPSAAIVEWCRSQQYPFEVIHGTVSRFVESDNDLAKTDYDVVLLVGVLEHLSDPLKELRALRQLMSPAGIIYIYTVNEDPVTDWDPSERVSLVHVLYLTETTIEYLLAQAGFEIEHLESRGTGMHVFARPSAGLQSGIELSSQQVSTLLRRYRYSNSRPAQLKRASKRWLRYPLLFARRLAKWFLRLLWPAWYSQLRDKGLP
jgi:SAM-dependent methyltransferase